MSDQVVVALITAGGEIVVAVVTAVLTRRGHGTELPPDGTNANPVEEQPVTPTLPTPQVPAGQPTTLGGLLRLMHQRNVKCLKGTAEALIGRFEFADITNTGLPPEYQALICKGDGTHTGRWNNDPTAISRVGEASLARNVGELRQQLGLNG